MTQFKSKMLTCQHDYTGTAKQPERLFCNHCGLPKVMADHVAELKQRIEELERGQVTEEQARKIAQYLTDLGFARAEVFPGGNEFREGVSTAHVRAATEGEV